MNTTNSQTTTTTAPATMPTTIREFTRDDCYCYGGAENFADGKAPLIATLDDGTDLVASRGALGLYLTDAAGEQVGLHMNLDDNTTQAFARHIMNGILAGLAFERAETLKLFSPIF